MKVWLDWLNGYGGAFQAISGLVQTAFAVVLTVVAILQWRVYVRQANIAETTRDIANAALGRPHIFVEMISHNLEKWRDGHAQLSFKFRVVNYGIGPAIVTSTLAHAFLSRGPTWLNRKDEEEVNSISEFPVARELWAFISHNSSVYSVTEVPILRGEGNPRMTPDGRPEVVLIKQPEVPRWRHFVVPPGKDAGLFASDVNLDWLNIRGSSAERKKRDTYLYKVTSPDGGVRPWLLGQIAYVDTLGRVYHTNFCGVGSPKGDVTEVEDAPYNERN